MVIIWVFLPQALPGKREKFSDPSIPSKDDKTIMLRSRNY